MKRIPPGAAWRILYHEAPTKRDGMYGPAVRNAGRMKRTPLRRLTPMRRSKPMRQRSPKRRQPTPEDHERMAWIRTLLCCAPMPHLCRGVIDPHHAGIKPGLSMKAPDDTVIPMCRRSHGDFEDHAGQFRGWTAEQRRGWQDRQIAVYQALWDVRQVESTAQA